MDKENHENLFLKFRLNACPICLICLDCEKQYGEKCTCQARKIEWKRKISDRDYEVNFCPRPFTQSGAINQKVALDFEFVKWASANISSRIELSPTPSNINICKSCMNGYHRKKKGIFLYIIFIFIFYAYKCIL
jgi:hypothetical protein